MVVVMVMMVMVVVMVMMVTVVMLETLCLHFLAKDSALEHVVMRWPCDDIFQRQVMRWPFKKAVDVVACFPRLVMWWPFLKRHARWLQCG